jgi:hypothetical protein
MPATDPHVEPIISHGIKPADLHADEEGALILDCTWTGERDEVTHKGDNHADVYSEFRNPRLTFELNLRPRRNALGECWGLGNVHPGQALTDLVNVAEGRNILGFVITGDMAIIAGNPKRTSNDEGLSGTVPGMVKPFTKSAVAIAALDA